MNFNYFKVISLPHRRRCRSAQSRQPSAGGYGRARAGTHNQGLHSGNTVFLGPSPKSALHLGRDDRSM